MVQANSEGDGVERRTQYATFRTDKAPSPGYGAELISDRVDPKYWDDLDGQPRVDDCDTLLKMFKRNVSERGDEPYLGTRPQLAELSARGKAIYGPYEWKTYNEVNTLATNFAKGMMIKGLCPETEGEGKMWRFVGIWAKNRWEWTNTLLAGMHVGVTTVGFYDAQSQEQVDFIIKQTLMTSIVCTDDYANKLVAMRGQGLIPSLKDIVLMNEPSAELLQKASEVELNVHTYDAILSAADNLAAGEVVSDFKEPDRHDIYIFSYTSGTTGDPKGVKLSHNNILVSAMCSTTRVLLQPGERLISYLPLTHSFEQSLFGFAMANRLSIGFYTGDPANIVSDCQALQPNFFPSVPRLYNKIYAKLRDGFEQLTGCKRWMADKAVATKEANYNANGVVTHGCWDAIIFKKMRALLGGEIRYMVTGSAPIEKQVIDFLKICFSCPIVEGYGLTESSAGSCIADVDDAVTGHVGGPFECNKLRLKDLPDMNYLSSDKPYPRGEICMYGPSITNGYYKREDKTAEAFDSEGWFLTGDVGLIYPNGSVKIIDRSKNIFKLSQGEYIAPEKIEQIMNMAPMIGQIFLYGDSFKNVCVAVIVPEEIPAKRWAAENGLEGSSFEELCKTAELKKVIGAQLTDFAVRNKLSSLEKPREFVLTHELFTPENGILTSTFKMKRNIAKNVFQTQINEMYLKVEASDAARAAAQAQQ